MGMRPSADIVLGIPCEKDDDFEEMLTFMGKTWEDKYEYESVEVEVPKFGKIKIEPFWCGDQEMEGAGLELAHWDWDDNKKEIDLGALAIKARQLTPAVCYAMGALGVPGKMIEKVKTFIVVEFG